MMPPGLGLCPCCSEPPVPRQTWQCQRVFSQLWVQNRNSRVGLVPNSHPSQQQTGSRASWRSAAFPSLLPMLAHTTSRSSLGKNPALWLPKSKTKTWLGATTTRPAPCQSRCPRCSSTLAVPTRPRSRLLNALSLSFLFVFPFLLNFSKNTLLQELENTQKQIEEHQHDKVNAATGSLP